LTNGFAVSRSRKAELKEIVSKQDILHFHSFIPAIARVAAAASVSIVYTEHGNFGFGRRRKVRDYLKAWLLQRFLSDHVDFLSFNSEFTRKIAEERYDLQHIERGVVQNGIDFNSRRIDGTDIAPNVHSRIHGKFVVGTSSRFAGFKRIDRLIDAFARFSRQRDAVLLLVGDGPLRDQLHKRAADLGVADKTIFAGYQANVRPYQNAMNVCVFPSQYEPFGLAAVETLSLGKSTIVFKDAGGMSEIIGGYCTEDVVDDVAQLAKRLEHYYVRRHDSDEGRAEARIQRAHEFDINTMVCRFADIYRRVRKCA
jgi:glycosyltransferase involved in cell wall biosynthesis